MYRKWGIAFILILLLLIFCGVNIYISRGCLTVTNYEILTDKLDTHVRIVQLTDLHNSEFGASNEKLISKVREQQPDIILLTGDLLNSREPDSAIAANMIRNLAEIAPVYASYGNHEKAYEEIYGADLQAVFEEAGAHVLEYTYEDIEINGQKLRLGGLYGYCVPISTNEAREKEVAFLQELVSEDVYTILLTHMPYCWILNDGISEWDVDCVFAGHDHGGQIRIPLLGGLYAPDQGWFPGRDCGLYYSDDREEVMVLSRGLGSTGKIPRMNNIPEIVVVNLLPES